MWKKILLVQVCICLFLATGYITIENSGSELLKEKSIKVVAAMSKHYTASDIFNKGKDAVMILVKTPSVVTGYVLNGQEAQQYAEPIDSVTEGSITSVYAVSGGQVTETGENDKLGKFIKIQHDNSVSIYGQCTKIYVKEGKHVRRGQVIGSYTQNENNKFYYDLIEE